MEVRTDGGHGPIHGTGIHRCHYEGCHVHGTAHKMARHKCVEDSFGLANLSNNKYLKSEPATWLKNQNSGNQKPWLWKPKALALDTSLDLWFPKVLAHHLGIKLPGIFHFWIIEARNALINTKTPKIT